jgi:uncharacterized protein
MPTGPLTGAFERLAGARYVQLSTFRRSGEAVPTPVWPVAGDGRIYAVSGASSGKVKRIRANPRVRLAACTQRGRVVGPTVEGRARVMAAEEGEWVRAARRRGHPVLARLLELANRARGEREVAIEVAPA